jgi:hypothetical protein
MYFDRYDNLRVEGNHLSIYNATSMTVWNTRTKKYDLSEYSILLSSGLSPDEATAITISASNETRFSIFKICPDEGQYYDSTTDSCKTRQALS